ncbi:hypothetical protein ACF3NT_04195 [Naumannella halotolerans]|uniref:hypothetical protein n=1 Tax=Naumannella halotolerans TaxID=993414 RepID=UPI00370D5C27
MITQLWELVVAPPEVPELSPGEIERTLEATGLPGLPSDYLELVKSYGVGCFDEFIFVLVPSAIREDLNLQVRGNEILAGYRQLAGIGKDDDNKLGVSVGNGIDGSEDLSYDVSADKGDSILGR